MFASPSLITNWVSLAKRDAISHTYLGGHQQPYISHKDRGDFEDELSHVLHPSESSSTTATGVEGL
jgi:hypothetical protein